MKNTSNKILSILKDNSINESIKRFVHDSNFDAYETTPQELSNTYEFIQSILIDEIESGRFDSFSTKLRVEIFNNFNKIENYKSNPYEVISNVESLHYIIHSSGLLVNKIGKTDFNSEKRKINETKRKYEEFLTFFDSSKSKLDYIEKSKKELNQFFDEINIKSEEIFEIHKTSSSQIKEINSFYEVNQNKLEEIKKIQESIEEKRLSISTFSKNIEEYKETTNDLIGKLNLLLSKEKEVDKLIEQANESLKLSSTVGISSAFYDQYVDSNKWWKRTWWIVGAILFLGVAVGLTIWIVSDIKNSDKIGVVIGRIAAVAISITGAAFCASQYNRQKLITEDYAYKAVLAKSIVAFSDEIATSNEKGEEHIGNYLNKVLTEIHKDPLRDRKTSRIGKGLSEKQIEQIVDIIKSKI